MKPDLKEYEPRRSIIAYSGAHPAHQEMFRECCPDNTKMLGEWSAGKQVSSNRKLWAYLKTAWKLRSSDMATIIIEGTTPTIIMAPIINCMNYRAKSVVALCADDALYRTFVEEKYFRRMLTRWSFQYVSGIIAIGDLTTRLAKAHLRPLPVETRYPPMSADKIESLTLLRPSLDSHNLLLIGGGRQRCKGVDIAVQCRKILQAEFPAATLTVLGFPNLKPQPGSDSPGPVKDVKPYLSSSSVLIQPVRGDAFPLAVIEAMLAGVVPFISEWTGAASVVEKVDPKLMIPLQANEFSARIAEFWRMDSSYRKQISDTCREVAREFVDYSLSQESLKNFILSLHNAS